MIENFGLPGEPGMGHGRVEEMLPYASDFAMYYQELRLTRPGWYKADQKPPVMEPPLSQEWVKYSHSTHHRRSNKY